MYLKAVLELMRGVENRHLRKVQGRDRLLVQRHVAQRRSKNIGSAQCQAPDGDPVGRTQQNDARVSLTTGTKPGVCRGSYRSGIDIAGVRHDQCLRGRARLYPRILEQYLDRAAELNGIPGVELAGDGGFPDHGHD